MKSTVSTCDEHFVLASSKLPQLRGIAEELFLEGISVETESDPEISECRYLVFHVFAPANTASALRREWYRRTSHFLNGCSDKVRLLISVER